VVLPRDVNWRGETVYTAIWKEPVPGRRVARRLNIDGDGQGDLDGQGGEHRAVMVYQMDSYHHWERHLGRKDFTYGQFGENFTVQGLSDDDVCIGDQYRIGSALFEVTQPRVTCYRVGLRMAEPRMPALLVSHHRPGFYLRALQEGEVAAGADIVQVPSGRGGRTVARSAAPAPPPGGALPAALAGQFLTLRLPVDPAAAPLVRSYSLSGPPGAPQYRISVKREPDGAGSRYVHAAVRVGDVLDVAAPRGTFTLR